MVGEAELELLPLSSAKVIETVTFGIVGVVLEPNLVVGEPDLELFLSPSVGDFDMVAFQCSSC